MIKDRLNPLKTASFSRGLRSLVFPFVLCALVLLSMLAGCQSSYLAPFFAALTQTTNSTPEITPQLAIQTSPETPEGQVIATPTEQSTTTTLVIWLPQQFDPESGTISGNHLKQRLVAFHKDYPNLFVEVRIKSTDGRGSLVDSITTASAAAPKALPALVALSYEDMETVALKGLLLPLNKKTRFSDDIDWLPYAVQLGMISQNRYGLPFAGDALVMAYRPLQSPYPPTTWQELALQNQVVTFPAADPEALVATTMYLTAGGSLLDENGTPVLQEDALLKSFGILNDGVKTGAFPFWISEYATFDQSWTSFVGQQGDYTITWLSQYLQNPPAGVSFTQVPKIGDDQVTLAQGWSWCIPALSSQQQQYSILLAEYLSDPTFVNQWDQYAGYLSVRKSGLDVWKGQDFAPALINLVMQAQIRPSSAIIGITGPILKQSVTGIIKTQLYYRQAVDQALSNFKTP